MNNWEKFLSKKYNKPFYYDKIKNKSLWSNNYNITIDNLDSEDWEEQKSSSGNKYFYNKKTGISQWKFPDKEKSVVKDAIVKKLSKKVDEEFEKYNTLLNTKTISLPKDVLYIETENDDPSLLTVISHYGKEETYEIKEQLGVSGKEGSAFLFEKDGKEIVAKVFKPKKALGPLIKEFNFQYWANNNKSDPKYRQKVSPELLGFIPNIANKKFIRDKVKNGPKVFMEKMDYTIVEYYTRHAIVENFEEDQYKLIYLALSLDMKGIKHNDPNPLNIMIKDNEFYYIDFGMSNNIKPDDKFPNIRALHSLFYGGMQGIYTRRKTLKMIKSEPKIVEKYYELVKTNPESLVKTFMEEYSKRRQE